MPRIDDLKIQEKFFKKKKYRSWDGNLLEKLKLTNDVDTPTSQEINTKDTKAAQKSEPDQLEQNKANTDRVQLGFSQGSNKVQSGFNKGSVKVQLEPNQGSVRVQLEPNQGSDKVQLNPNNRVQSEFITDRIMVQKLIEKLGGNEKKIFLHVINLCSIKGSLSTGEIIGEELTNAITTTRNGRETAIKRLSKKGLLKRDKGKTGANGTLCLYVSELIKSEALNYLNMYASEQALFSEWGSNRVQKLASNRVQLGSKSEIYSSSININTTTKGSELPKIWENINIEPLKDIGFSQTQLKQLYSKSLNSPEIIQDSIYQFAFGLDNNPRVKQYSDPLNVFMGVLRKGQAWVEQNYQSPQEIAQQQLIERKKAERKRLKQLEDDAYKLALGEWQEALSREQLEEIAPPKKKNRGDFMPQHVKLSLYFKEKIWPKKKSDYLICDEA